MNLRSSQRRNASYILSGVFLRQRTVLDSYTSSCLFGPCFGLFMICPYTGPALLFLALPVFTYTVILSLGMMFA